MLWPLHYPTTSSTVVDRIASTSKRSHSFQYLRDNSTEIFMSGAGDANDDMVVGRINNSEDRTLLVATNGGDYEDGQARWLHPPLQRALATLPRY
jgi:hypothetical protein